MPDKLDYYELLSTIVPGTLLLCCIVILFPAILTIGSPNFPDAFTVVALTALAIFAGQFLTALASLVEPLLNRTFGGRPSEQILDGGQQRVIPRQTVNRIKRKLKACVGEDADDYSLFLFAMQLSEGSASGRVPRFNSLYAYHRTLVVLILVVLLVFFASTWWGAAAAWSISHLLIVWLLCFFVLGVV